MIMLVGIVLTLLLESTVSSQQLEVGCMLPRQEVVAYRREGDIILGGLFLVHWKHSYPATTFEKEPVPIFCDEFQVRSYREVLMMVFAIEEIERNPNILSNITLGFQIHDSCLSEALAVAESMSLLSGTEKPMAKYRCSGSTMLPAVVGEVSGAVTLIMANILGVHNVPQISYGSTLSTFSNKKVFPSFYRTVPSDSMGAYAIASLLRHFGWSWVGILASNDDAHFTGSERLKENIKMAGGCIAFSEKVSVQHSPESAKDLVDLIERSTANVIVVYSHVGFMVPVFEEAAQRNLREKVWLGSTTFIITPDLFTKKTWETLNGTMALAFHDSRIPGFKEFVHSIHPTKYPDDIFIKLFWEKVFRCKWHNEKNSWVQVNRTNSKYVSCSGKEQVESLDPILFDLDNLRYTYNVYLAVYAFAHALHDLVTCTSPENKVPGRPCVSIENLQSQQILHHLRNVHFVTSVGEEIFFDENGDPPAVYDILQWQIFTNGKHKLLTIGSYDSRAPKGQEIIFNKAAMPWNSSNFKIPKSVCSASCTPGFRKAALQGQPSCCYDCVPCDVGEISNDTDAIICMKCEEGEWSNEERNTCIPRTIEFLSFEEPLGIVLAVLSLFLTLLTLFIFCIFAKFQDTPIVKANNRGLSYLLLVSLKFCFLCSLIFIGYPRKWTCILRQMAFGLIFSFSVSCILAKTITVIIAFNATKPNSRLKKWVGSWVTNCLIVSCLTVQLIICSVWLATDPPYSGFNTTKSMKIIIQCYEGSTLLFYCMLGYLGFLAGVSFIVAFLGRKLPDSFNEAKYITFSLLVFLSVWLSFIPAYLSTQGKYMVAVEVFAILASSSGLLSCIFFHKIYIILLRPEMNTKRHLLDKTNIKNKVH